MTNQSSIDLGGWDPTNLLYNQILFIIYILATINHCNLWLQLFLHKTKFDLSFIFSLGYIAGDVFLILSFFTTYSMRIRSWIPVTRVSCYFEAYSIFYFNLLQCYDLTLLNVCRYYQIVRSQNIYKAHRRKLIVTSVVIPLLVLANLIIQKSLDWCIVRQRIGSICDLSYTNIIVRIWNLIMVLLLPILISFYMLVQALYFLRNVRIQQTMIHRNHHRRLIVHSLIFYSIWIILWFPLMLIGFFDLDDVNEPAAFAILLASTVQVLVDPFIAFFLDKRFAAAWKKSFQWSKQKFGCDVNTQIHPAVPLTVLRRTMDRSGAPR